MTAETFAFGTPATLDANDGTTLYVMGDHFTPSADGSWTGVEWYVPATLSGDNHYILAYQDGDNDTPRKSKLISPVAGGGLQQFLFTTPLAVTSGVSYRACVLTNHYVFTSGYTFPHTDSHLSTDGFFIKVTLPDEAKYPDGASALNFHISPIVNITVPLITGTASAVLGALAGVATGIATVNGTAAADLGFLTANAMVAQAKGNDGRITSTSTPERITSTSGGGRL